MTIKLVVDENIPFAREAFRTLGDVTLAHGRSITAAHLSDADGLIVRSITPVNAGLLENTPVKFVATATAGIDHVDIDYLLKAGISFASAAGSNANSVAEYIVAAWLEFARNKGLGLEGKTVGIIGVGNVGSKVEARARALGMIPVLNDPPLARKTGDPKYRPLEELLDCDVITFHTPLNREGEDRTWRLADGEFFARLKPGVVFCNSSRGEVVEERALHAAIDDGRIAACVLDVWENEPKIDTELLRKVDFGTPHIAGYSYDGKVAGTVMTYWGACAICGVEPTWDAGRDMLAPEKPELEITASGCSRVDVLTEAVEALYPIARDDRALRETIELNEEERGPAFDRLRKQYPVRREFYTTRINLKDGDEATRKALAGLGFKLK